MTGLLERLAAEVPRHHQTIQNDALGQLVTRHMAEIEEARERGYSWTQIYREAKAMWQESGEWREGWVVANIEARYRKIKKKNDTTRKERIDG